MSLLNFDPKASLKSFRKARPLPNLPIPPNRSGDEGSGLARLGRLGTVTGETEKTPAGADRLADAIDHFEERAAIREYDGGQNRLQAEAVALIEAATFHGVSTGEVKAALMAKMERAQA
ncbi:hypothetical protein [Ruegeria sp. AU67]|uniref:hypothetical protein n=1 Tax=Ruegeria sp. AU67 TaxID=2108530 RepID=UPI000D685E78|nr:hypothetical protein [Ruegeria sp. AU67]